ncbi:tyrosine-type recombinase/integrase, partial [Neokomagataea anthophila]
GQEQALTATTSIADDATTLQAALRDQSLFTLLYGTVLRISEALALNICDLGRTGHDTLIIRVKGGKERLVPLLP